MKLKILLLHFSHKGCYFTVFVLGTPTDIILLLCVVIVETRLEFAKMFFGGTVLKLFVKPCYIIQNKRNFLFSIPADPHFSSF
jgi:hypothetical protein